jgi:two-component system phosphate regulon response regulator OmpR
MAQQSPRILVVDDDQALCGMLGKFLSRCGYAVECASTPGDALTVFKTHAFDLVLVDLLMPGMTGQELAPHIKRHNSSVPIVLISAFPPDRIEGVDHIYPKPISPKKLREIVESVLGTVKNQAQAA